jgi:hypothetical protein
MRRIVIAGYLVVAAISIYLGVTTQDDQLRILEFVAAACFVAVAVAEFVTLRKKAQKNRTPSQFDEP